MSDRPKLTAQDLAAKTRKAAIQGLIRDERFKKFMLWFFTEAGIFQASYRSTDRDTSHAEGRRDLGNRVLIELLRAAPEARDVIFPNAAALLAAMGKDPSQRSDDPPTEGDDQDD